MSKLIKSKSVLVVGGFHNNLSEKNSLENFHPYLQGVLNASTVDATFLDKLLFSISNDKVTVIDGLSGRDVSQYDVIYIRGPMMRLRSAHAYYLSRFCKLSGITCINDYSMYYPATKVAQMLLFKEESMPFLKTVYSVDRSAMLKRAESDFGGYPMIIKTIGGSHGDSNYLVNSYEEAISAMENEPGVDFMTQEYCENNCDYRVLVANNSTIIFSRRGSELTHVNNTSKGGEAELIDESELPESVLNQSMLIAKKLNLMIAGVDVMPRLGTDEYYFLEVNSQPQLTTGAFLDEKKQFVKDLFDELS